MNLIVLFCSMLMIIVAHSQPMDVQSFTEEPLETTTYDWGKHTGSTYDWGKHTGSTYDWGKHTSTKSPSTGTTEENHDHDHDNDDHHQDNDNQYRCGAGKYSCAGTIGLCIDIGQICDQKIDCPHGDDENPNVCHFKQPPFQKYWAGKNRFSGTGFQFQIRNIKVDSKSKVELFDQNSDNKFK